MDRTQLEVLNFTQVELQKFLSGEIFLVRNRGGEELFGIRVPAEVLAENNAKAEKVLDLALEAKANGDQALKWHCLKHNFTAKSNAGWVGHHRFRHGRKLSKKGK